MNNQLLSTCSVCVFSTLFSVHRRFLTKRLTQDSFFKLFLLLFSQTQQTREPLLFPLRQITISFFSSIHVWSVFVHRPQIVDCMETAVRYEQSLTPLGLLEPRLRSTQQILSWSCCSGETLDSCKTAERLRRNYLVAAILCSYHS